MVPYVKSSTSPFILAFWFYLTIVWYFASCLVVDVNSICDLCGYYCYNFIVYFFHGDFCISFRSCECNTIGSTSGVCNALDGLCDCKTNVNGSKCDQCAAGTFNLDEDNPKGCQECFCFHHSSVCDSAANYVKSEITSDFRAGR